MPRVDYEVYIRFMGRWTKAEQAKLRELENDARHYPPNCPFVNEVRGKSQHTTMFAAVGSDMHDTWETSDAEWLVGEPVRCSVPNQSKVKHVSALGRDSYAVSGEFEAR